MIAVASIIICFVNKTFWDILKFFNSWQSFGNYENSQIILLFNDFSYSSNDASSILRQKFNDFLFLHFYNGRVQRGKIFWNREKQELAKSEVRKGKKNYFFQEFIYDFLIDLMTLSRNGNIVSSVW